MRPIYIRQSEVSSPGVPVQILPFTLTVLQEFLILCLVICIKNNIGNRVRQLQSLLVIKADVPGPDEVRDEAGEAVPGRTDGHVGEVNLGDGPGLDGGGDGTVGPAREGLVDHDSGPSEASNDYN